MTNPRRRLERQGSAAGGALLTRRGRRGSTFVIMQENTQALPAEAEEAASARALLRREGRAALATTLAIETPAGSEIPRGGGAPYVSLVLFARDLDAAPLLLLSDLAQHTRNLAVDPRLALLIDGTAGHADPLAGPRLTVLGRAAVSADPRLLARFTARHPESRRYAGFGDFHLYRVAVERAHLVAGFGRIKWIAAAALLEAGDLAALAAAEPQILAAANADPAALPDRFAHRLGRRGTGWRMTGIDPGGVDLCRAEETARLDFAAPARTPQAAREALSALAAATGGNL